MAFLKPDKTVMLNGVNINEFLLTNHNPNKISMPNVKIKELFGVTIHNTGWIKVSSDTTPAEQYTRATYNGNMNDVRVHFYTDHKCAWQNLPIDLSGWHAADGSGDGNRKTIAIECIMSSKYNNTDKQSEDNAARLAAYLLFTNGLGVDRLFTHTHWLNVRDGKKGTTDQLNVMKHSYKMCPAYILPHWNDFKLKVATYIESLKKASVSTPVSDDNPKYYRVRKSWDDSKSQIGAYSNLDNAKAVCKDGYSVYDWEGNVVYTAISKPSFEPYLVKIVASSLNIRKTPKWGDSDVVGVVNKNYVFTIVEETMLDGTKFGKLKSGAGWISLGEKYVKKV